MHASRNSGVVAQLLLALGLGVNPSVAETYPVMDTGQDAQYAGNPPTFELGSEGSLTGGFHRSKT